MTGVFIKEELGNRHTCGERKCENTDREQTTILVPLCCQNQKSKKSKGGSQNVLRQLCWHPPIWCRGSKFLLCTFPRLYYCGTTQLQTSITSNILSFNYHHANTELTVPPLREAWCKWKRRNEPQCSCTNKLHSLELRECTDPEYMT